MKIASTDYFTDLGRTLTERCGEAELSADFPHIAGQLLEEHPPEGIDFDAVLDFALQGAELPKQVNLQSGFGQPPLVVYEEPRFYLELLVWFPSRTSIHGHGFVGAFAVVSGYSIEAQFRFHEHEQPCPGIKFGELDPVSLEFIAPGKVNRILEGDGFIHSVGHMGNPSLTLVIRTDGSQSTRQYSYFPNGLGIDLFLRQQMLGRQSEMLRALAKAQPARFVERLCQFVAEGDPHRFGMVLHDLDKLIDAFDCRQQLLGRAEDQFGAVAARIDEGWSQQKRSARIWGGLSKLVKPEVKLTAALRDFFPTSEELNAVLSKSFPGDEPEAVLERWRQLVVEQVVIVA